MPACVCAARTASSRRSCGVRRRTNHDGRRRAKKIGDRDAAKRVARQIREHLAAGDLHLTADAPAETLDAYARAWLESLSGNLKASTIKFYGDNLKLHVLPLLGTQPLDAVSRRDARELIVASRKKGLKLNTVKGIARTLSTVLSQAVEDEKTSGESGAADGPLSAAG